MSEDGSSSSSSNDSDIDKEGEKQKKTKRKVDNVKEESAEKKENAKGTTVPEKAVKQAPQPVQP